ncbi:hypothetical protein SHIRM173S_07457 [Streptomyces hirsutus]
MTTTRARIRLACAALAPRGAGAVTRWTAASVVTSSESPSVLTSGLLGAVRPRQATSESAAAVVCRPWPGGSVPSLAGAGRCGMCAVCSATRGCCPVPPCAVCPYGVAVGVVRGGRRVALGGAVAALGPVGVVGGRLRLLPGTRPGPVGVVGLRGLLRAAGGVRVVAVAAVVALPALPVLLPVRVLLPLLPVRVVRLLRGLLGRYLGVGLAVDGPAVSA